MITMHLEDSSASMYEEFEDDGSEWSLEVSFPGEYGVPSIYLAIYSHGELKVCPDTRLRVRKYMLDAVREYAEHRVNALPMEWHTKHKQVWGIH